MARALESEREIVGGSSRGGIVHGLRVFSEETSLILNGEDNFAESLIENAPNPSHTRMQCYRAALRTALYLSERNLPFDTPG